MVACYARHPHFSQSLLEFKEAEVIFDLVLFGTQVLDHAPHGCCSISPSHSRYSACCSSQAVLGKLLVPPLFFAHLHSSLFDMLLIICPWQTTRCCRCIRFWQTSSIKIIAFFAFVSFTDYRYCPPRAIPSCLSSSLSLSVSFNRAYTFVLSYAKDRHSTAISYGSSAAVVKSTLSPRHRSLSRILILGLIYRCSSSSSSATSTSRTTAPRPRRSSPLERAYCHEPVSVALATSSPINTVVLVLVP